MRGKQTRRQKKKIERSSQSRHKEKKKIQPAALIFYQCRLVASVLGLPHTLVVIHKSTLTSRKHFHPCTHEDRGDGTQLTSHRCTLKPVTLLDTSATPKNEKKSGAPQHNPPRLSDRAYIPTPSEKPAPRLSGTTATAPPQTSLRTLHRPLQPAEFGKKKRAHRIILPDHARRLLIQPFSRYLGGRHAGLFPTTTNPPSPTDLPLAPNYTHPPPRPHAPLSKTSSCSSCTYCSSCTPCSSLSFAEKPTRRPALKTGRKPRPKNSPGGKTPTKNPTANAPAPSPPSRISDASTKPRLPPSPQYLAAYALQPTLSCTTERWT